MRFTAKVRSTKSKRFAFEVQGNQVDEVATLRLSKPTTRPLRVTIHKRVSAADGLLLGPDFKIDLK